MTKFQVCQEFRTVIYGGFDPEVSAGIYPVGKPYESIEQALAALLLLKGRTEVILPIRGEESRGAVVDSLTEVEGSQSERHTTYGGYVIQPVDDDGNERAYRQPNKRTLRRLRRY